MGKKRHITITGDLGSGKSSIAARLAERYGATRISTGAIQRDIAAQMGITTLELNRQADIDPSIDQKIDSVFASLEDREDMLIVDSRMAWHFMPHSFKICMTADPYVAAARIWHEQRAGEGYATIDECYQALIARRESERARFFRTYGVRLEDPKNYDLVVDTTERTQDETARFVFGAYDSATKDQ